MGKRVLSALCALFFLAALCPTPGMCSGGGGGGGSAPAMSPTYYYRPSDPVMAQAYNLSLLRWIQPETDYDSFVRNPSEGLTRLECAELMAAFCNLPVSYEALTFADTGNLPAVQNAVMTAVSREGVMAGYADKTFRPDSVLSKAAGCKVLCNALFGMESSDWYDGGTSPFPDVPAVNVFAGSITLCKLYGIITAEADGNFRPADALSRKTMVEWLLAAVEFRGSMSDYLFVIPPRDAASMNSVTSGNVGNITNLAVYVTTKQLQRNAAYAAVFYMDGQFKGMGIISETLNDLSGVVTIPIGGQSLSGSTTVKLYALDPDTLRPLSPPAVFDLAS